MQAFRFNGGQTAPRIDLLPPERTARTGARPSRRLDVVDADFETVPAHGRRNVYPVFNDNRNRRAGVPPTVQKMQPALASRAMRGVAGVERLLQAASPRVFAGIVACLCLAIFLALSGFSGGPSATAGSKLEISGVTAQLGDANGMRVVSVYGNVENRTGAPAMVPAILIDVTADGRTVTASRILSGKTVLHAGETRPFAARLPHVGGILPQIKVSFSGAGASAR